jgi:AMP phosphorylase
LLYKKVGEKVKKGEKIFTIFAEKERKIERAIKLLEEEKTFAVGERMEMLIHEVKELPLHKKAFILER